MSDPQFSIKRASRQGVRPLIGLYSESGCGKTYSALLLARGIAGPTGKIIQVDSESGRGSLYADVPIIGGYETLEIAAPFSPGRYIEAIQEVERAKPAIGIIDSGSHEWEGIGGVLDQAAEIEEKSGKPGLHVWRKPKLEHAKFVLKLVQSSIPWIICLRAKYKSRQGKNAQGKTEIIKDDHTTPIQADDFIFEMTAHAEIFQDHKIRLTKWSHPALKECFPKDGPITIEHGQSVARWCNSTGGNSAPSNPPQQQGKLTPDSIKELKTELWGLLGPDRRGTGRSWDVGNQWLIDETLMDPTDTVSEMNQDQLRELIEKVKKKLAGPPSGQLL